LLGRKNGLAKRDAHKRNVWFGTRGLYNAKHLRI